MYDGVMDLSNPSELAIQEVNRTEREMNAMMQELNDIENQIKGNKDLKEMENLMKTTNEVITTHFTQTETLKNSLMLIT